MIRNRWNWCFVRLERRSESSRVRRRWTKADRGGRSAAGQRDGSDSKTGSMGCRCGQRCGSRARPEEPRKTIGVHPGSTRRPRLTAQSKEKPLEIRGFLYSWKSSFTAGGGCDFGGRTRASCWRVSWKRALGARSRNNCGRMCDDAVLGLASASDGVKANSNAIEIRSFIGNLFQPSHIRRTE